MNLIDMHCDTLWKMIQQNEYDLMENPWSVSIPAMKEADGSKHLPVKYPGAHEPVIYPYSTKIILVMGLWTLGEPIKKTVFRYEELIKRIGWREEDGLTFEMLNVIIRDGYMKKLLTEENSIEMQILFTEKVNGELHYIGYEEAGEKYGLQ